MPDRPLEFRLGRPELLPDLLHELGLHDEVAATTRDDVLVVTIPDTATAAWEVRAVVRAFDETATEL